MIDLAKLARIDIDEKEAESLSHEFDVILNYVGEIKNTKVLPLISDSQGKTLGNIMREDVKPHESGIYTKKVLEQAPMNEGYYIKVKKIL